MNLVHIREERRTVDPIFVAWDLARREAIGLDKLPIAALRGPQWHGRLLVIHEADLEGLGVTLEGRTR